MAMTREDYRKQGAEHFDAGVTYASGSMDTHVGSWQRRAFAEGYNERAAEHAKVSGESAFDSQVGRIMSNHPDLAQQRTDPRLARVEKILDGYLDAVVFTGVEHDLPEGSDFSGGMEFSEEARSQARKECEKFYLAAGADLGAFVDLYPSRVSTARDPWEAIGHDLWLTRNGHGAGFWDRNMGRVGKRLADLCGYGKPFAPATAYLGDDELVYFS